MTLNALDYEQIRQLLARYNFAIDLGDPQGWAACFTSDGVFECTGVPQGSSFGGRHVGREALTEYAKTHYARAKGHARHWNWTLEINGDGDNATMRCYLLALTTAARAGEVRGGSGIYRDKLRRVDGSWLFAERHIHMDDVKG